MKRIQLIVLALSMCCTVIAQDDKPQFKKITFGVKAGVNFANGTGNGLDIILNENPKTRIGFALGGLIEYKISENFSLQSELTYGQQGFREKVSGDYEATVKLDYLNFPMLAKYYVADRFSIEVGPQIGFLLSAKFAEKDLDDNDEYDEDIKEFFKNTYIGVNFGVGYQLENGLGINARYNLGITDIFDYARRSQVARSEKVDEEILSDDYEIKNRVFQISVYYMF